MTYFTYRGVEVPLAFAEAAVLAVQGLNDWTEGVDAAFDSPTITRMRAQAEDTPVVPRTPKPLDAYYIELVDGEGDTWFQLPDSDRFALWSSWSSRASCADYYRRNPEFASDRAEVESYGGIASERQRTGDTQ